MAEVAKWLFELWSAWDRQSEVIRKEGGKRKRIDISHQESLILQDLSTSPEALLEIDVHTQAFVGLLVAKFARELGCAQRATISSECVLVDDVSVHERRTAYVLQIASYIRTAHIAEMLARM